MEPYLFTIAFWLGPGLLAVGLALLFLIKVWPKVNGSTKAAAWMVGVGFGLCLVDFVFIVWLLSTVD